MYKFRAKISNSEITIKSARQKTRPQFALQQYAGYNGRRGKADVVFMLDVVTN